MNDDSYLRTFGVPKGPSKLTNPDEVKQGSGNINEKSSIKGGSKKGDSLNHPILEEEETQGLMGAADTKSNPDADNIFSKNDKKMLKD